MSRRRARGSRRRTSRPLVRTSELLSPLVHRCIRQAGDIFTIHPSRVPVQWSRAWSTGTCHSFRTWDARKCQTSAHFTVSRLNDELLLAVSDSGIRCQYRTCRTQRVPKRRRVIALQIPITPARPTSRFCNRAAPSAAAPRLRPSRWCRAASAIAGSSRIRARRGRCR